MAAETEEKSDRELILECARILRWLELIVLDVLALPAMRRWVGRRDP
jgi:hypothetical protein